MEYVAIVTILVLIQYLWFGTEVGIMRGRHGVNAPATTGAPEFERMFRVQQNTMEQLVVVVPALWIFATYVSAIWAAGLGIVIYRLALRVSLRIRKRSSRSQSWLHSGLHCGRCVAFGQPRETGPCDLVEAQQAHTERKRPRFPADAMSSWQAKIWLTVSCFPQVRGHRSSRALAN